MDSGTGHYGGLVALAAMVALLALTALCAVKVSKQRCCDDNTPTHNRSSVVHETPTVVTEASSTSSIDEPPSYDSVFSQTTQYLQGVMGNFFSRVWPGNQREVAIPKCHRCGQTRRLEHRRNLCGNQNLQTDCGPYYISVCCEQVPSPVDKPPEYWAWVREKKTTNMFTSQVAPPTYDQISQTMSNKVSITTGRAKSSSLSKKSGSVQKPLMTRSMSDTALS